MLSQAQYGLPAATYDWNIGEGGEGEGSMPTFLFNCTQFMLARTVGEPH